MKKYDITFYIEEETKTVDSENLKNALKEFNDNESGWGQIVIEQILDCEENEYISKDDYRDIAKEYDIKVSY